MKSIMYHYVRPCPERLEFFRYLRLDHFRSQLDWFMEKFRIMSREEFFGAVQTRNPCDGIVLTFDDGFSDHFDWVFPELVARGIWGIFYVPTGVYQTGKLLDVHRIHMLLGRMGGAKLMALLDQRLQDEMLSDAHRMEFRTKTYAIQDNDAATLLFKRTMNYYISYEWREQIIDELMQEVFGLEEHLASRFYLALDQVRQMHDAGMVIGSHSVTHPVFSKLPITSQEAEIKESFEFLQNITGAPIRTFCYPHGGRHTFSLDTERLLEKYGCDVSFAVEPREITQNDLISQPQALPRHDCNLFPFGQASMGLNKAHLLGSDPPQLSNQ